VGATPAAVSVAVRVTGVPENEGFGDAVIVTVSLPVVTVKDALALADAKFVLLVGVKVTLMV
jgi:hypothetical protein